MRKTHKYKSKEVQNYLKGLEGRDKGKNIVWDKLMQDKLQFMGVSHIDVKPASIVDLEQVRQAFENFDVKHSVRVNLNDPYIDEGIKFAYKCFGGLNFDEDLSVIDLEVVEKYIKQDTSAGLTEFGVKKRDAIAKAIERAKGIIEGTIVPEPCLTGIRTQMKDDGKHYENFEQVKLKYKGKTRLVWMYPTEMTLIEAMFAVALIDRFKKTKTPMAIGLKKGTIGARVWNEVLRGRRKAYAIDYSKYDSTISADLIRVAFRILKTNFGEMTEWQEKAWSQVVRYFIHTPIVFLDGFIYRGKQHGVPSGSFFTQLIDSVVNVILLGAASKKFGLQLDDRSFMILGDDVILGLFKRLSLEELSEFFAEYGIICHPDKTERKPHFLGADWFCAIPTRKKKEVITKMVYPETYREKPETMSTNFFTQLLVLSYNYCYWNLTDLLINTRIKGKSGTILINDGIKFEDIPFEKIDIDAVVSRMPGYIRYHHNYIQAIDLGRPIELIQFG